MHNTKLVVVLYYTCMLRRSVVHARAALSCTAAVYNTYSSTCATYLALLPAAAVIFSPVRRRLQYVTFKAAMNASSCDRPTEGLSPLGTKSVQAPNAVTTTVYVAVIRKYASAAPPRACKLSVAATILILQYYNSR